MWGLVDFMQILSFNCWSKCCSFHFYSYSNLFIHYGFCSKYIPLLNFVRTSWLAVFQWWYYKGHTMAKSTWIGCPGIYLSINVHNTANVVNMYCTSMFGYSLKLFYEGYNHVLNVVSLQFWITDHSKLLSCICHLSIAH